MCTPPGAVESAGNVQRGGIFEALVEKAPAHEPGRKCVHHPVLLSLQKMRKGEASGEMPGRQTRERWVIKAAAQKCGQAGDGVEQDKGKGKLEEADKGGGNS